MTRSCSLSLTTSFSRAVALTVMLSGALFSTRMAQADEFSLLPTGDPVYGQLSSLTRPSDSKITSPLTRYEAALQAARSMLDVQNRDPKLVTRGQWRAIKALSISLKAELRQLGVDPDAIQVAADRGLKALDLKATDSPSPARQPRSLPTRLAASPATSGKAAPRGSLLMTSPGLNNANVKNTTSTIPLSQQLRVSASLMATERVGDDPFSTSFGQSSRALSIGGPQGSARSLASETSVAYDLNRWLTLRGASSQRNLAGGVATSPLLGAPMFDGATQVKGAGGGVDINVGSILKFSTDMERLRTNTGAGASRIGGGASLSMNRLSMAVNIGRLQPEDVDALPALEKQFGIGVDVTQRLKLNLLYQSLFAQNANNTPSNASRISGGISLSF